MIGTNLKYIADYKNKRMNNFEVHIHLNLLLMGDQINLFTNCIKDILKILSPLVHLGKFNILKYGQ